jgi:hypothetical protein
MFLFTESIIDPIWKSGFCMDKIIIELSRKCHLNWLADHRLAAADILLNMIFG